MEGGDCNYFLNAFFSFSLFLFSLNSLLICLFFFLCKSGVQCVFRMGKLSYISTYLHYLAYDTFFAGSLIRRGGKMVNKWVIAYHPAKNIVGVEWYWIMAEAGQPSAIMVSTISLVTALKHPQMDKSGRGQVGSRLVRATRSSLSSCHVAYT